MSSYTRKFGEQATVNQALMQDALEQSSLQRWAQLHGEGGNMTEKRLPMEKKDLVEVEPRELTPLAMLQKAAVSGASVEVMERLMSLQERYEKNNARKAFDAAMADIRNDLPQIIKNREVDFTTQRGRTHYRYEDLAEVVEQISPVLAKHKLSFRWRTKSDKDSVHVVCIVSHADGHSEETELSCKHDLSGNKNEIQAIGSGVTYLQRYTLKAALGLAAALDDDAQSVGRPAAPSTTRESSQELDAPIRDLPIFHQCPVHHASWRSGRFGLYHYYNDGSTEDKSCAFKYVSVNTWAALCKAAGYDNEPKLKKWLSEHRWPHYKDMKSDDQRMNALSEMNELAEAAQMEKDATDQIPDSWLYDEPEEPGSDG